MIILRERQKVSGIIIVWLPLCECRPWIALFLIVTACNNIERGGQTLTLKMTTAQIFERSVTINNSPIPDYTHPEDHTPPSSENRPLPSSKNPHFQNEARCTTFLVKMSFVCMRMKNDFQIKGWAPTLVLKQRPAGTRKWPININLQDNWIGVWKKSHFKINLFKEQRKWTIWYNQYLVLWQT